MWMNSVQWLNPIWLWAAGVAGTAVVLAHLMGRRSRRVVMLPTVRFLQQASDVEAGWRLRGWLVAAWRAAIVMLPIVAMAGPRWTAGVGGGGTAGDGVVVYVLDRSASMMRREGGATLFEKARGEIMDRLLSLDPGRDRAGVVLLDGAPRALLPEPTGSISDLAEQLRRVEPTYERGEVEAALAVAGRMAAWGSEGASAGGGIRGRSVEVFSDFQGSQRPSQPVSTLLGPGVSLHLRAVGQSEENFSIWGPAATPREPVVGQPLTVTAEAACWGCGEGQSRTVTVRLRMGHDIRDQKITLEGSRVESVSFVVTPASPGLTSAEMGLVDVGDDWRVDNETGLFLDVKAARRVVLVSDAAVDDPASALFYVARALVPDVGLGGVWGAGRELKFVRSGVTGIEVGVGATERLRGLGGGGELRRPVDEAEAVILVEAGGLDDAMVRGLGRYLEAGGAGLWVVDSEAAAASLKRFFDEAGSKKVGPGVLSAEPLWLGESDVGLAAKGLEGDVLSVFEGPSGGALLRQRFRGTMLSRPGPGAQVMLEFTNGGAGLYGIDVGKGRLGVLGSRLNPGSSELVKGPVFVPLLHQILRHVVSRAGAPTNPKPGESYQLLVEGRYGLGKLEVLGPRKQRVDSLMSEAAGAGTVVAVGGVRQPGRHVVVDPKTGRVVGGFYVEVDPREGDFTVKRDVFDSSVAAPGTRSVGNGGAGGENSVGRVVELWPWIIGLALLCAAAEPIVVTIRARSAGMKFLQGLATR